MVGASRLAALVVLTGGLVGTAQAAAGVAMAATATPMSASGATASSPKGGAVKGKAQFVLSIPGAHDGSTFPRRRAPKDKACGAGQDLSPPLAWRGVPAGTQSFAITMYDPDGKTGLGVIHWIHYGLPADLTHLPEGAGQSASIPGVGGTNSPGNQQYHGPCPPAGEVAHHYVIEIYALDLPPDALKAGMTRDAFLSAVTGHVLANTSIVQRYGL